MLLPGGIRIHSSWGSQPIHTPFKRPSPQPSDGSPESWWNKTEAYVKAVLRDRNLGTFVHLPLSTHFRPILCWESGSWEWEHPPKGPGRTYCPRLGVRAGMWVGQHGLKIPRKASDAKIRLGARGKPMPAGTRQQQDGREAWGEVCGKGLRASMVSQDPRISTCLPTWSSPNPFFWGFMEVSSHRNTQWNHWPVMKELTNLQLLSPPQR